jgi:hypothetical protein
MADGGSRIGQRLTCQRLRRALSDLRHHINLMALSQS